MSKPILCVDFDGVVHAYTSPWTNAQEIHDGPVPGALRWLWKATEWFDVQIYSSRSKDPVAILYMRGWMIRHSEIEFGADHPMSKPPVEEDTDDFRPYPIGFAHEKPAAFLTIDDRAFCFEGDWSELEPADLLNFKPWNKRGAATDAVSREHAQRVAILRAEPAVMDILAERIRQVSVEGWSADHDDHHDDGQMALAAAAYAYTSTMEPTQASAWQERLKNPPPSVTFKGETFINPGVLRALWPWAAKWFKPKDRRSDLVRAGALIVAEIERLDRKEAR